ncbi:hypothetical protein AYO44_13710 [Planctomycetaceae bacterium SCGC AG-212-F19]|nr:hypothetical protein AYO44_13710 [Planctomycetaceae bacterium SCGC AG-212-F19]
MSDHQVVMSTDPNPLAAIYSEEEVSLPTPADEEDLEEAVELDIELDPLTGADWLKTVESDDAQEAVANWRITAVGNRPRDHMGRDFLFGSLFRDYRPTMFSRYAKEPPEWMLPLVNHLPAHRDQLLATQHVILHYLHRQHLLEQVNTAHEPPVELVNGEFEFYDSFQPGRPYHPPVGDSECRELARMWRCWPYGVQTEWLGPGVRTERDVCGLSWLCPWCLARRVVELHDRLQRTVMRKAAGKHLVMLRANLPANQIRGRSDHGCLWRSEIDYVRRHFGTKLRTLAASLGVRDGLLTYQAGPAIGELHHDEGGQVESFHHQLNLLGEVTFRSERRREQLYGKLGIDNPDADWVVFWESPDKINSTVDSVVMPADDPQALRLFLAGSSPRFCPSLELGVGGTNLFRKKVLENDGIPGAISLEPLFMLDRGRWCFYREAVRGLRMFNPFGSWREALGRDSRDDDDGSFMTAKQRSMRRLNAGKQQTALERRQRLLAVARPLWDQVVGSGPRGRGRPARRQELAGRLIGAGIPVSMRDLKWLVNELQ